MGIRRLVGSSLRRVRWLHVLSAVWLSGATFYWWHRVPPVADLVIPRAKDDQSWANTNQGDIVISRGVAPGVGLGWDKSAGPVDVVSASTGEVKARRLEKGDEILAWPYGGHFIAAANETMVKVVDLDSGRIVVSQPTGKRFPSAVFSLDGRAVAIAVDDTVAMYSLETGERKWTRQFTPEQYLSAAERRRPHEIEVTLYSRFGTVLRVDVGKAHGSPNERYTHELIRREFLSAESEQPDFRFGPKVQVIESSDGRFALVGDQHSGQVVYDLVESRILWKVEPVVSWCQFSPDSQEVWEFSATWDRPVMCRWRTIDGTPLAQIDQSETRSGMSGMTSPDGRYFIGMVPRQGLSLQPWIQRLCSTLGFGWKGVIVPEHEELSLIDWTTGRIRFLGDQKESTEFGFRDSLTYGAVDDERFTLIEAESITVYRFDAPRNWLWLAGWGVGPVAVASGASWLRARSRRRRALQAPVQEAVAV